MTAANATFKRIAIVAPSGRAIVRARDGLIRALVAGRHSVACIAPDMTAADAVALKALGAETHQLEVKPPLLRALADHAAVRALAALLATIEPHVVLSAGRRLGALGALAARKARAPRIVLLVNGLGPKGLEGDDVRLLRRGMKAATSVLFHNSDDARVMAAAALVPPGLTTSVVAGAGVDLAYHAPPSLPALEPGLTFLMIARIDRAHGVLDYCEAARRVRRSSASAQFLLAGPIAADGDLGFKDVDAYADTVDYLGDLEDERPALARAHVFVYPSQGEGMPRAVLEALAAARPVIAADTPGCRATVDERVNGCLVPAGDASALVGAMESFLKRPDLIPAMARASRSKAERLYDERAVIRDTLAALGIA